MDHSKLYQEKRVVCQKICDRAKTIVGSVKLDSEIFDCEERPLTFRRKWVKFLEVSFLDKYGNVLYDINFWVTKGSLSIFYEEAVYRLWYDALPKPRSLPFESSEEFMVEDFFLEPFNPTDGELEEFTLETGQQYCLTEAYIQGLTEKPEASLIKVKTSLWT